MADKKIISFEEAIAALKAGKKVAPVGHVNPDGKVAQWLEKVDAGGRQVVAQIGVGQINNWNMGNDLSLEFVEVTPAMLPKS